MKDFPPNINPQLYNLTAVIVGAALVDDFSVAEQSAIGNWLMLVSQYIITHAAQQNLIEKRSVNNLNNNNNVHYDINYLYLALEKICQELEKLKNER